MNVRAGFWRRSSAAWSVAEDADGYRPVGRRASLRAGRRYSAAVRARILRNVGEEWASQA